LTCYPELKKNKFLLTPELAPTFSLKDDDLLQSLAIITTVLDGHGYESDSGVHGKRGYSEDIMFTWLGAAVDIPHRVHKHLSTLGPKLYFFRLSKPQYDKNDAYEQMGEDFRQKFHDIRITLLEYLAIFEMNPIITKEFGCEEDLSKIPLNSDKDEELARRHIIELAYLLGPLRATVPTWETKDTQGSNYAYSFAIVEAPSRAVTQLYNLAKGHALSQGRNYVTEDDIPMIVQTVLSTASLERVRIFELLIENKGRLKTSEIVNFLNTTNPTARRTMTELRATGLVEEPYFDPEEYNPEKEIVLKDDFHWFLGDKFKELRGLKEKTTMSHAQVDDSEGSIAIKNNKIIEENIPSIDIEAQTHIEEISFNQNDVIEENSSFNFYCPEHYCTPVRAFNSQAELDVHIASDHVKTDRNDLASQTVNASKDGGLT